MRRCYLLLMTALFGCFLTGASRAENRCGWYQMPTPGNLWLTDREGTWSITSQGQAVGPDAIDAERAPDFDMKEFVSTGVPGAGYGYGCACISMEVDAKSKRVIRIHSGKIKPLSDCKSDKSLAEPSE